jgi:deazaflavin-dependent oxidoreductase (nitroreductase family)
MALLNTLAVRAKDVHNVLYRRFDKRFLRSVKGMPILLLTVAGRRSGKPYTTPVVYFRDGSDYVVCASAGGAKDEPQWFRNVRSAQRAHVEVGDRQFDVAVRVVTGDEYERLWARLLEVGPFFAGYDRKIAGARRMGIGVLTPAVETP